MRVTLLPDEQPHMEHLHAALALPQGKKRTRSEGAAHARDQNEKDRLCSHARGQRWNRVNDGLPFQNLACTGTHPNIVIPALQPGPS